MTLQDSFGLQFALLVVVQARNLVLFEQVSVVFVGIAKIGHEQVR